MGGTQAGSTNQGNRADYLLGTSEGWDAFSVVRWHAVEEISRPYLYDITLTRDASNGTVNLDTLLDTGATFAVNGQSGWRMVHGVLAEAAEIDQTSQTILYRVLLVPHVWRARHRTRCRNFLDQPLQTIVTAVLENRSPAYPSGHGGLTWPLTTRTRQGGRREPVLRVLPRRPGRRTGGTSRTGTAS